MKSEVSGGRRPLLLGPMLLLTDKLRTSARLAALVVVLLVPGVFATWSYTWARTQQIEFSALERQGVAVAEPALVAFTDVVGGEPIDLSEVEAAVAAHPDLGLSDDFAAVQEAAAAPSADTPEGRLALAEEMDAFVTEVANSSNLILDPDLDSFYVMEILVIDYPRVLTAAAQAAALPEGAPQDELVGIEAVAAGQLKTAADALDVAVATALDTTADPTLAEQLTGVVTASEAVHELATEMTGSLADPSSIDPSGIAGLVRDSVSPASGALDSLLATRIGGMEQSRLVTTSGTVLGLGLALWLGAAVWWRSNHDVSRLLVGVKSIAEGDLEKKELPTGRDEMGDIGRALTVARRRLVETNERLAREQAERDRQMQANFAMQKDAERQVRKRAQQIIDETANTVTEELGEVSGQVHAMREAASTIDEQVTSADRVATSVVHHVKTTDSVVATLGESLRRVAGITELIASVADQSKLLALNATIEAARAGEAGQGFGVVAGEVKNLATTTGSSTTEIASTVATLERDTAAVSEAIREMSSSISELDSATRMLRSIAEHQRSSVSEFEQVLDQALDRVRGMSGLSERLERRRHERYAVTADASLLIDGREVPVHVADVSESGVRLVLDADIHASIDSHGELSMPNLVTGQRLPVRVARASQDGAELGLEFLALDPEVRRQINAYLASLEQADRELVAEAGS